jgi:hypothetical protein
MRSTEERSRPGNCAVPTASIRGHRSSGTAAGLVIAGRDRQRMAVNLPSFRLIKRATRYCQGHPELLKQAMDLCVGWMDKQELLGWRRGDSGFP